jgi:hypothetical protein
MEVWSADFVKLQRNFMFGVSTTCSEANFMFEVLIPVTMKIVFWTEVDIISILDLPAASTFRIEKRLLP